MILRETLKQEIDMLNESQLTRIAGFIDLIKSHAQKWMHTLPSSRRATGIEKSQHFREWVAGLPKTGVSLPDEAFDRESIYR